MITNLKMITNDNKIEFTLPRFYEFLRLMEEFA